METLDLRGLLCPLTWARTKYALSRLKPGADLLVLVKPQFELSRGEIGSGGVVRDAKLHAKAVERVSRKLAELGFRALEPHESALPGAAGNREYFLHAVWEKDE